MKIIVNSTPLALWHEAVSEARQACQITLEEELEAYLVFLLMRYHNNPNIANNIMATQFLAGQAQANTHRQSLLQAVGDECLLFSGLFPNLAEKRRVRISYFVQIGRSAYISLSSHTNDIYELLAQYFVALMDILQSLRQYTQECPNLLPLQAYELWNETGSQRALRILEQYRHKK